MQTKEQHELRQCQSKLIDKILGYIREANDSDEEHFAFALAQSDIKKYLYEMHHYRGFSHWFTNRDLRQQAKKFLKDKRADDQMASVLNVAALATIKNNVYQLEAKIVGPANLYYTGIRKRNIKAFINDGILMKLKLTQHTVDGPVILLELGDNKLGQTVNVIK